MKTALLLPLLVLAAAPARADTIWPPPAHVEEARFAEPAVTIDGETAATLGDVNRLVFDPNAFIPGGRSWARAAQKLADDFLLAREAKARGATSAEALVADGLPEPTEDELRADWARELAENPRRGRVEERVEASHILVPCPKTATAEEEAAARARIVALRDRVLAGEDFAAVAREASECPSRGRGGALGWFGRGRMVPEFERAAFSQPVGETGDPVRTEFGFHLVLVTGREPGRALAFEEVREGVSERRRMRLLEERRLALLEPLRAAARIEYDPACDPANPTNNVPVLVDRGDGASLSFRRPIPPSRTSISNAFEAIAVGAYAAARGEFDFDLLDPVPKAVLRVCEERLGHFPWHFLHAVRPFGADAPTNGVSGIVFLGPDDGRPFPDRMLAVFNWSSPATTRILRFAGDFSADEPPLRDPNALLYDFEASRVDLDETSDRPALRLRGFYRHKGLPAELVVEIDANGEFAVRETRHAEGAEPEPHAESAENAEPNPHAESAEEEASPEVAKSTSVVFDEIVDGVIAAVDEGREPDLRIPPADEWGNPFSVTNGPDFVKVESFGPDGKRSEDDFLLVVQWGDGFVTVRRVYFDEELKCQGEEGDHYDW